MGTIRTFFPKSVHFFRFSKKDRGGSPPPLVARLSINLKLSECFQLLLSKKKEKENFDKFMSLFGGNIFLNRG